MLHLKQALVWVLLLAAFISCTTTKKRGEVSKLGLAYHNITSKYNRNFNANLLIDETMAGLEAAHREDYSQLLPIYPLLYKENPTQVADPMDRAIEKASVAIAIHRPSHWTDDNYFIIGQSQYIKEDFESAEATFRYLVKHYDPENILRQSEINSRSSRRDEMSEREQRIEKKADEKERKERIKEREQEIKERRKEKKRQIKARKKRIKDRKDQIKEREQLAKRNKKKKDEADAKLAAQEKKKKEDSQVPMDEDPVLPKVKGNPDNYFLKHKPVHQRAQLWLAKTLIERDHFGEAENILRILESNTATFDEIRREVYAAQAHSALSRGQDQASLIPLEKAAAAAKDRRLKARYAFITAQVYEQQNQSAKAAEYYDQVVRLKPDYEMSFNAELNKLKMQWNSGSVDHGKFETALNRMIRDDKNTEYQDQLYHALAIKDLKTGNFEEAIANLSASIRNSTGNKVQQAESYYTIAELYYEREDYVNAKYYFDSTLTVMTQTDDRYSDVSSNAKNLEKIAANLELIQLQDSLIRLSQMSDKELKAVAAQIKKEAQAKSRAREARAEQGSDARSKLATISNAVRNTPGAGVTSNFFAYDDRALKRGQREFERTWGPISLEDNWRRSNRSGFGGAVATQGDSTSTQNVAISDTEVDEIFKQVPKSDSQLAAANKKIEDALLELGRLFRSDLDNNPKSVESLEELLERYPNTEHALDAYYMLYVGHTALGNSGAAAKYADLITSQHADSEYAKYIEDPSYLQNLESEEEQVEKFYQDVHELYAQGEYQIALKRLIQSRTSLGTSHALQSKFTLLSAMCIGRLKGRESYVNALKELIAKYPGTDEEERAKEIIRLLGIRFTETSEGIEEINPDAYFSINENDKLHMVLVSLKSDVDGKTQGEIRASVSDYNDKYHKLNKLNIATIVLDGEGGKKIPLLVIRRFNSREEAMKYYDGVQKNIDEFIADSEIFEVYVTTQQNYRKIVQLRSIDLYRAFFVKEYLAN